MANEKHDLWEYKTIAQKFVRWLGRDAGPLAAVLGVENGWFVGDRKVMIERVWIQVAKATPAAAGPRSRLHLDPRRSADHASRGRGQELRRPDRSFRGEEAKDSTITVPAGTAAKDLPDTPLPWADLTCHFAGAKQAQRGGDLRSSRPSGLSAHLADAALRPACASAGRA